MEVVVVGAGMAGLVCARQLVEAGHDVLVLEARERIGGRILSWRDDALGQAELGAQVLHDAGPLLPDLPSSPSTSSLSPPDAVGVLWDGRLLDAAGLAARGAWPPWVVQERILARDGLDALAVAAALEVLPAPTRSLATHWFEQTWASSATRLQVGAVRASRDVRGAARRVVDGGNDVVVTWLASGVEVRTGQPVHRITVVGDSVRVVASGATTADAAVVTVPAACLAAGSPTFDPPLEQERLEAASLLAGDDALALVVRLDTPARTGRVVLAAQPPFGLWEVRPGSRLLTGHVKGPRAAIARAWLDDTGDGAPGRLLALLGLDGRGGRASPGGRGGRVVARADWGRDPWAAGAYSPPVAGAGAAAATLADPHADRVFFAGEATVPDARRGLVQGAGWSGQRAADEVHALLAGGAAT